MQEIFEEIIEQLKTAKNEAITIVKGGGVDGN